MLGLLQLSLLATMFTLVAGNCSVRSVQQKDRIKRCRQVQECIKEAFYSNENNLYVIDSVFMSTQTRLPVELIIEYEVTMNRTTDEMDARNNTGSGSGLGSGSGSGSGSGLGSVSGGGLGSKSDSVSGSGYTEDDKVGGDGNLTSVTYTEEIGWSTNGIHKGIRSKVIVLLQPALIWWTMSWAIGDYGFPETIQFEVKLTECHQVENITKGEVKEALEYLTTNLHHKTTEYTWNTDMNFFQHDELWLFIIEALLTLFTTLVITLLLPKVYGGNVTRLSGSAFVQLSVVISGELVFAHLRNTTNYLDDFYSSFRIHILGWATLAFAILGIVVGFVTSIWYRSIEDWIILVPYFALVYVLGAWVSASILPILIQAFVYPTETITTIGFTMIFVVTAINGPSMLKALINVCFKKPNNASKKKSKKTRICCKTLAELIFVVGGRIVVPNAIYGILYLYLSLLRLLQESPTSQLTQTLLAFLPTAVAVIITYFTKKNQELKNKSQNKPDPPTEDNRDDDESRETVDTTHTEKLNSPDNNPSNDTTSEDEQPGDGQPRTGEMAVAENNEESQELRVEVEVHQSDSNSLDQSIMESTV